MYRKGIHGSSTVGPIVINGLSYGIASSFNSFVPSWLMIEDTTLITNIHCSPLPCNGIYAKPKMRRRRGLTNLPSHMEESHCTSACFWFAFLSTANNTFLLLLAFSRIIQTVITWQSLFVMRSVGCRKMQNCVYGLIWKLCKLFSELFCIVSSWHLHPKLWLDICIQSYD